MELGLRQALLHIDSPYHTAQSMEALKRELHLDQIIRLGANENNYGYSPLVEEAIRREQASFSRYPDGRCTKLRERLMEFLDVSANELVFGHGCFELLSLCAQISINPGEETIIPQPTFNWYQLITLMMGGIPVSVSLSDYKVNFSKIEAAITEKTRVIWLCNPNNPTGTIFGKKAFLDFLKRVPEQIFVVLDEAYYDYADDPDYPETAHLPRVFPNLIVLRTFSKVYGLASMRVGYGIAHPVVADAMDKIHPPLNVSAVSQAAALASLQDRSFRERVVSGNRIEKQRYYTYFENHGFQYIPTQSNFVMVDVGKSSEQVTDALLKKGILVRAGAEYGMANWLRISIGTEKENALLFGALDDVLGLSAKARAV